ncbi:hypothetical protein [Rhinolophus gammaherpesvirus 1]|uniref:Uncharacterized protein n=1 Tax=Rhinolophus gammaherpesvirus 1 TaxID=2054179 RepID=A0A2Z5U793_9GAMA|nr:hypothetical protein [Rhinolophus gammaherpesvirus 1]BBB06460.1 hypothetical protein [Rhinolophus gammaherpesvirus 1]
MDPRTHADNYTRPIGYDFPMSDNNIFSTCYTFNNPKIIPYGTAVECVFLCVVLYMVYIFAIKTRFRPSSNIWLFCGCCLIILWICTKISQDYIDPAFKFKCVITENMVIFCSLFGSSLNVGMCVDRCRAVYSCMSGGTMSPTKICLYTCVMGFVCLLVICGNVVEMTSQEVEVYNSSFTGCFNAATHEAYNIKNILKMLINSIFVIVVVTSTMLTVKKIMSTNLRKKVSICVNVILVTLPITFIWLVSIYYSYWEVRKKIFCPKLPAGNIFIYLSSLPMLLMLLVYLFTGENLKKSFNTESKNPSISLTSVLCGTFPLTSGVKRDSRTPTELISSK